MIIFHHNDPDGFLGAAIIAKNYNLDPRKNPQSFVAVNYPKEWPMDKVPKNDLVILVDVSFGANTIGQLMSICDKSKNVLWIDHHNSSMEIIEDIKNIQGLRYFVSAFYSGSCLAYMLFNTNNRKIIRLDSDYEKESYDSGIYKIGYQVPGGQVTNGVDNLSKLIPDWCFYIDDYDCWKEKDIKSCWFMLAMQNLPLGDYYDLVCMKDSKPFVENALQNGEVIYNYLMGKYERELPGSFECEIEGIKTICSNGPGNSWVFGSKYKEYDMACLFRYDGESHRWKYSLYASNESVKNGIDCSKVAGKYKGGGHKGAAGLSSDQCLFNFKPEAITFG